ncbi:hypothetical protein ALC57_00416 [Trachymyrmex cornetzi]|uniref:Uncharacterized protein n=1 Tax=Trachymyrmex cornetzi TaxID=471704 RepID=A0A151JRY3_9HYME|nr:hypothetical protein ALC57_00416 [Trachymyrmex cornetzi]
MRSSKNGSPVYSRYQSSEKLRTANPKDCKNLTFDALTFFLLMQPDERVLSSCDVTDLIKNSLFLCVLSAPIFIVSLFLAFYFLYCYALSASIFVRNEIQSATLFHRAIVTLQLLELTSRGFAIVPRFAVGSICFFTIPFVVFFLIVFFGFMPMPIVVLVFIAAQTAAATALSRFIGEYLARRVSVRSLLRDTQCRVLGTPRPADLYAYNLWLIASSAEYTDRKTGSPGYVTRKEARLSLDSIDYRPTLTFATVLFYLRCRTVDVHSLPRLIVVLAAATIRSNLRSSLHVSRRLIPHVVDIVTVHS